MKQAIWRLAGLLLLGFVPLAAAQELVFESPVQQVTVLELYTSHGCNSCPPADAWLRRQVDHPGLWQRLVPLSFHVDYWDYLGWRDRFARAAFSARQRAYAGSSALTTVYTPAMVLTGREWRGWLQHNAPPLTEANKAGVLRLTVAPGGTALLEFQPVTVEKELEAYLVVLGFGIESPIGGGENAGKTLREDFVVLGMSRSRLAEDSTTRWQLPWPELKQVGTSRRAVAAWVSRPGQPQPLQATAGWLP